MNGAIQTALANGAGVALGLFVLWTLVSRIPRGDRAFYAGTAGLFSAGVTLAVLWATGVPVV